ncbi:hypothetical protein BH10PSE2_BH10PSE2_23200 [soil metagenome]
MTRGRVLIAPVVMASSPLSVASGRAGRLAGLALGLILFGGLFQYVIDLKPMYLLAKAWPVLTLPLSVGAALKVRPSYQPLVLTSLAWMLAATAFIGIGQLGNDALGAVASTAKIWPLTGALGACAALTWLRPSAQDLTRAVAAVALLTFGFLAIAWLTLPPVAFEGSIETTKVFLTDPERGRRINAPMMYAIMGLLLLNRFAWSGGGGWGGVGRRILALAAILLGVVLMLTIYKQRAQIAGTGVVLVLGAMLSGRRWRGPALLSLAAGVIGLALPGWLWLQAGDAVQTLGGSLSIRQVEATAALDFLNAEPWRWITGVGSATRIGGVTLGDIVGTPFFFPSDLGWLGVVFEYGLVGAGLMLALHVAAIVVAGRAARSGSLIGAAVFDYAVFLLVVSPIVSVALSPGEMATCLALGWWLGRPER